MMIMMRENHSGSCFKQMVKGTLLLDLMQCVAHSASWWRINNACLNHFLIWCQRCSTYMAPVRDKIMSCSGVEIMAKCGRSRNQIVLVLQTALVLWLQAGFQVDAGLCVAGRHWGPRWAGRKSAWVWHAVVHRGGRRRRVEGCSARQQAQPLLSGTQQPAGETIGLGTLFNISCSWGEVSRVMEVKNKALDVGVWVTVQTKRPHDLAVFVHLSLALKLMTSSHMTR